MRFSHLEIRHWRQFRDVKIHFHPRLTVIAGANGAGKSTLIRVLAKHFGWPHPLLATPTVRDDGSVEYLVGNTGENLNIGEIGYSDGSKVQINVPIVRGVSYELPDGGQRPVPGLHIDSHRSATIYRQVGAIPTQAMDPARAYLEHFNEVVNPIRGAPSLTNSTYRMKEAIISMAVFGPGNAYVQPNAAANKLFQDFRELLATLLPPSIGFQDISVRVPEVVLVTRSGDFLLDASSGGLMSLIDIAWRVFLYSRDKAQFTVSIDEPENHLHPSMQRGLVPRLLKAFPGAQFIIATHSPFVVSSVKDSRVYVLRQQPTLVEVKEGIVQQVISSVHLDHVSKAGTASEILRDVLGVRVTLPEWAEEELRRITAEFSIKSLDEGAIAVLRESLDAAGLGEFYPEALREIADRK